MDTNWKHQKDATTTEQENRSDDQRMHEADKRHLKESAKDATPIPKKTSKPVGGQERTNRN